MREKFLYISSEEVDRYLSPGMAADIVKGLWEHWRDGSVIEGERSFLAAGRKKENEFLHMPVCLPGMGILGFKWINCYMEPAPGYPFSHGNLIVLNDIETGSLLAVVSGTGITAMRTAGGHGVAAARYLAKGPVRRLSVIGSGSQAARGMEGFLAAFPELDHIRVYCRQKPAFEKLASRFGGRACVEYEEDISRVGRDADVILTATSSPSVLLRYEYLEKGVTVMALDARNITGELPDVAAGIIPGRESQDEIIVYTHMGSGAYDVACAYEVYKKACEDGRGTVLGL